jgi:type IV secretory pathway protease TraF
MAKRTGTTAWDHVWEQTDHIHFLGSQHAPNEGAKEMARAMARLSQMRLPIDAIYLIGDAIEKAYDSGHDSVSTSHEE